MRTNRMILIYYNILSLNVSRCDSKLAHFVSRVSDMIIFYLSKIFSITDYV